MLSSSNVERLIAEKRREIEREKTVLGLWPADHDLHKNVKEGAVSTTNSKKQVNFAENGVKPHCNDSSKDEKETILSETTPEELDDSIPPGLERYIRVSDLGIPVFLIASSASQSSHKFTSVNEIMVITYAMPATTVVA
ncbi:hypothetical protein HF086_005287 [Spodoptera exigua]|uniref:Uncharacterized protein n=1 Tax=Spodoptera exigua TaxID=7107 RepID=A0A922MZ44_SPOEX|nr:hypothetical protein HF086_005287 [Spodoptera exigua]